MLKKLIPPFLLSLCLCALSTTVSGLVIQLNNLGGAAPGSPAGNGFQEAAEIWSSVLSDPITVRLDVGFSALGTGILGSTRTNFESVTYSTIRNALIQDKTSLVDTLATNNLQLTDDLRFLSNNAAGTISVDNNASNNNRFLDVPTANLKALNLRSSTTTTSDGSIQFSTLFNFDFDRSNGISSNAFDFVGVAIHEIGHALGFVSGVDTMDFYSRNGPGAVQNLNFNQFAIYNVLDLFRYSVASVATAGGSIPDLAIGDRAQYYSLNKGKDSIARMATGSFNGDGRQASHFKDNLGIGLMDPTLSRGQLGTLTMNDLIVLDSIGYNLVTPINVFPGSEDVANVSSPSTLACFILGGYGIIVFRRKKLFINAKKLYSTA